MAKMIMKFLFFFSVFMKHILKYNHPMSLSLLLVVVSVAVGAYLFYFMTLWSLYSIILIFLGGMMVLFLYISTLSNSEKMISTPRLLLKYVFFLFFILSFFSMKPVAPIVPVFYSMSGMDFSLLFKFLGTGSMLFLVVYLLLILFSVVELSESFKGAFMKFK